MTIKYKQNELFFGFGANHDDAMIEAIIGRRPRNLGKVTLHGYELCVQKLEDITDRGANPRAILSEAWGDDFESYVIRENRDSKVIGTLYEMTRRERVMVDIWELVHDDWQQSIELTVELEDGSEVMARTELLNPRQSIDRVVPEEFDKPWLMPRSDFVRIARWGSRRYFDILQQMGY